MTKYKRIAARIERDKARRAAKRKEFLKEYDNFSNVITTQNYVDALKNCNKGVNYKSSVQEYNQDAITRINSTIRTIESGKIPTLGSIKKVHIRERGKERIITPIRINDRMTQRVLCDNALVPVFTHSLIYDNGASMKGKGVDFARNRLYKHLNNAVKEYGSEYYALTFDFKSFFDSISHRMCLKTLYDSFDDKSIIGLTLGIIKSYPLREARKIEDAEERTAFINLTKENKGVGICLGSQISQVMALIVPNKIDHYIKDKKSVKYYIRYMDDGVILHNDKEFLKQLLKEIIELAESVDLHFNPKKTKITKISKGFTFMKVKYFVREDGKVIHTLVRSGVVRMRRKLKKFKIKVDNGEMTLDDVYNSMQSWLAHSKVAKSYQTRKKMLKLYDELFGGYGLTRKYRHNQNKLKQEATL